MVFRVPSMKDVLLELAREHEDRARVLERLAAEGGPYPAELRGRAQAERRLSACAVEVAAHLF